MMLALMFMMYGQQIPRPNALVMLVVDFEYRVSPMYSIMVAVK